jgi:NitT/TauT family transport system substrate-binding protein
MLKPKMSAFFILALLLQTSCSAATPTASPAIPAATLPAATLTVPAPATPAITPVKVNVCYSALTGTQSVTWYAYENGLFAKYGLDVNLVYVGAGSKTIAAIISGNMDICQMSGSSVVSAVAAGQDVVLFAGFINTIPGLIMAQPGITTPGDLKGKIIADDTPGTQADTGLRLALQQMGLDPDKDVTLLSIGGESERRAAMEAKQADATIVQPPLTYFMRQNGYVTLFDLGASGIPYQGTGLATTRKYIADHRAVVVAFAQAVTEAIQLMKNDPQGSKAVMAKYLQLDPVADAASLEEAYAVVIQEVLNYPPFTTHAGIQTEIDVLAVNNPDVAGLTPAQVVDDSIIQGLVDGGFINSLH